MAGTWRSGDRPKSRTLTLLTAGELRQKHKAAPAFTPTLPTLPARLTDDPLARECFDRLLALLGPAKVIDASHTNALVALALSEADMWRAHAELVALRARKRDKLPRMQLLRLERQFTAVRAQHMRDLAEFGLTPMSSARTRTLEATAQPASAFAGFLARKVKAR